MSDYVNPSIATTLLIALIGFVTVFIVLVVLMGIIMLISKIFGEKNKPAEAPSVVSEPISAPAAEKADEYTGVKLNGVDDKTAALLMAIVANKLGKELDNLRFVSIKEVK